MNVTKFIKLNFILQREFKSVLLILRVDKFFLRLTRFNIIARKGEDLCLRRYNKFYFIQLNERYSLYSRNCRGYNGGMILTREINCRQSGIRLSRAR